MDGSREAPKIQDNGKDHTAVKERDSIPKARRDKDDINNSRYHQSIREDRIQKMIKAVQDKNLLAE